MLTNSSSQPVKSVVTQIGSSEGPQIEFDVPDDAVNRVRPKKGQFKLATLSQLIDRQKSAEKTPRRGD